MTAGFRQSLSVTQRAERARSRGVSPVIGVILLVAITIVLAASIGVVFFSLSDLQDASPQAAFDTEVNEEQGEALLTVQRGEQIDGDTLTATGGTIVEAPETLRAGSGVLIDLEEDAEQLQLLHQQGDQSRILTEMDRKPFINVTVRDNPPIPGVSVAAERAETGNIVAEGQTDENGIVRLPVDDPEQEYEIVVQFDEPVTSGGEEITAVEGVETTTPDELEITTEDIAGADEDLTSIKPEDISSAEPADLDLATLDLTISDDYELDISLSSSDDRIDGTDEELSIPFSKDENNGFEIDLNDENDFESILTIEIDEETIPEDGLVIDFEDEEDPLRDATTITYNASGGAEADNIEPMFTEVEAERNPGHPDKSLGILEADDVEVGFVFDLDGVDVDFDAFSTTMEIIDESEA